MPSLLGSSLPWGLHVGSLAAPGLRVWKFLGFVLGYWLPAIITLRILEKQVADSEGMLQRSNESVKSRFHFSLG